MGETFDDRLLAGLPKEQGGLRLGNMVVRSLLGTGGMGAVYLAYHEAFKRDVAVKVLPLRAGRNRESVARFIREAEAALKISHPNLVRAYEVGQTEGLYYIVMEYVEGETAARILASEKRFSEKRALQVCLAVAEALREAHGEGIVHRDVKPGNILVAGDGAAKLADLGLAKDTTGEITEGLTHTGQVVGTPSFMSPEQATDAKDVDERTDIYSLGATLYALITGRKPHDASNLYALIKKVVDEEPLDIRALRPDVSDSTRALVLRMMSKDRRRRFRRMQEVVSAMRLALEEASPEAPRKKLASSYTESPTPRKLKLPAAEAKPPAEEPSPKSVPVPRRPSRAWRAAAILLVACAGTGGIYLYWEYRSQELSSLGQSASPRPPDASGHRTPALSKRGAAANGDERAPEWANPVELGRKKVNAAPELLLFSREGNALLILSPRGIDFWGDASWDEELAIVSFVGSRPKAAAFTLSGEFAARAEKTGKVSVSGRAAGRKAASFDLGRVCTSVAVSPEGRVAACGTADGAVLVRTLDGKPVARLGEHGSGVNALAFSPDGKFLAAAASDGVIVLWDAESFTSGEILQPASSAPGALAFSPDSSILACATGEGVELWQVNARRRLTVIAPERGASAVSFDASGRRLAAGFGSGVVILWQAGPAPTGSR